MTSAPADRVEGEAVARVRERDGHRVEREDAAGRRRDPLEDLRKIQRLARDAGDLGEDRHEGGRSDGRGHGAVILGPSARLHSGRMPDSRRRRRARRRRARGRVPDVARAISWAESARSALSRAPRGPFPAHGPRPRHRAHGLARGGEVDAHGGSRAPRPRARPEGRHRGRGPVVALLGRRDPRRPHPDAGPLHGSRASSSARWRRAGTSGASRARRPTPWTSWTRRASTRSSSRRSAWARTRWRSSASPQSCVVVLTPGMGDDIQAIKAGLMEVADLFVVNKADRDGADRVVQEILQMLELGEHGAWIPPVLKTVATTGAGLDELIGKLEEHRKFLLRTRGRRGGSASGRRCGSKGWSEKIFLEGWRACAAAPRGARRGGGRVEARDRGSDRGRPRPGEPHRRERAGAPPSSPSKKSSSSSLSSRKSPTSASAVKSLAEGREVLGPPRPPRGAPRGGRVAEGPDVVPGRRRVAPRASRVHVARRARSRRRSRSAARGSTTCASR